MKVSFTPERNGKVGEELCSGIHAAGGAGVEIVDIIVPQGIGVAYDAASRVLRGRPAVAGDHVLRIHYRFAPAGSVRPLLVSECLLTVNPDPRSLWQSLPSDKEAPNWKPDEDEKYMRGAGERRLAAASKRGRSHAHVGGFREDDFFLDVSAGWNVLAVADGAGSAKMSRRASQIAVQNAGEFLKVALGNEPGTKLEEAVARSVSTSLLDPAAASAYPILGGAVLAAVKAIEEEADTNGLPVKDYSTTLILGVHKKTFHGHLLASYWVGDGGVAAYRKGLGVEVLGEADSGEFAGQTRFLDRSMVSSYDEILKRIRVTLLPDLTALVLMTDGVSDPIFETDRNLADPARWDTFWGEIEPHLTDVAPDVRLLGWLDFWSQGNHDDRTIAVLW
ncbi:MAG: PP2C family serine/threonine-protein phosphatase [Gammaproteobacteria bacterium]